MHCHKIHHPVNSRFGVCGSAWLMQFRFGKRGEG
jgi:hypothetical protein